MTENSNSNNFKRHRKSLMVMPLLALPFLAVIFWSLGGGKGDSKVVQTTGNSNGFNMKLPGAHLKDDKGLDKLSFYQQADKDSEKLEEKLKADPYYRNNHSGNQAAVKMDSFMSDIAVSHFSTSPSSTAAKESYSGISMKDEQMDPNEAKVYQKLDELKKAMKSSGVATDHPLSRGNPAYNGIPNPAITDNVSRLEKMIHGINQTDSREDPQITRLNGMLDKIIEVQHPERMQDSLRERSLRNKAAVYPVVVSDKQENISLLESASVRKKKDGLPVASTGFLNTVDEQPLNEYQNSIEAIVPVSQTLVSGSTIKLQLIDKILIAGTEIPKGSFIYGTVSISNERLKVSVNSIGYRNSIFPVSLEVYDRNGMTGIYIPGAISRDVGKQSADDAINGVSLTSLDPSIGAQAATAGIQAAKSLISKKVKLIQVTVKGNYSVLLKDSKSSF